MFSTKVNICVLIMVILESSYGLNMKLESKRSQLLEEEQKQSLGGTMTLTDKELDVNNCLMRFKFNEIDYAFENPQFFNFSQHYFAYKDKIKNSKVYAIIKDLPKGAALHIHDMGILGPDYILNITYADNLYVCSENHKVKFLFCQSEPSQKCSSDWKLMKDERNSAVNISKFDEDLRKHFTMTVPDPDKAYPNIQASWKVFMTYFETVSPLLSYRPIWEQYFYDALKQFRNENIMYVEVRSVLPSLYELDGTVYDTKVTAQAYKKSINRFIKNYPDFVGAKLIYAPSRNVNQTQLSEYISTAKELKKIVPSIFAGFDLVGPEDGSGPLIEFSSQLLEAASDLDYFFHAGETDWYGTQTDENLVDAILLGAKRLGHAYALPKHPLLIKEVKKRNIGIEVNVISNAVLSLVRDVRNHPLATFIAANMPVVLSSDDPGIWEADVISHDFYVAFVGVASKLSDLRLLKTLAENSLAYSALSFEEKKLAQSLFRTRWNNFVNTFDCSKYL